MRLLFPVLACWLTVGSYTAANAQSNNDCVAFEEAIRDGIKINPNIDGAEADEDIAKANLLATLAQSRPQVGLFAQLGEGDDRLQNNQRDNQVGLQINQPLYNFGVNRLAQASAREQVQAAAYSVEQAKEQVAQEIGTAYLETLRSSEVQKLSVEQEEYYLRDSLTADERLEAQAITLSDASQIKASAAVSASQRIDATLFRDQARARLALLLDRDQQYACPQQMSAILFAVETEELLTNETLDSLLTAAIRDAPSVKQLQAQIRAARATTEQNRRVGLPNISAQAFVAYEKNLENPLIPTDDEWSKRDRIGLNVTSEIYSGGLGRARVNDAQARLRAANSDLAALRASLEDTVTRAWVRLQSQQNTLLALEDAKQNYKVQLDNIQSEYRIGTRPLADVVQAAERYYSTASNEINTRYQYYNNLFILRSTVYGITG